MADNCCENTIRAGKISGNPVNGLCDRVCIEVNRVFDGCISRFSNLNFQLVLTDVTPGLIFPYTFVSAVGRSDEVTFINQSVTYLGNGTARIIGDVVIPVTVTFTDATGQTGTANSTVTLHRDIILKVPSPALIPYSVSITANLASEIGTFVNETTVNIICCVVIVTKIIVKSDIVVPSYGFSVYPDCTEGGEDLCTALLNLPLFSPLG